MLKVNSNLKLKITDCVDLLVRFKADESGTTGIEYAPVSYTHLTLPTTPYV